ncbi:MAG: RluA family pseudouridine synthase [Anaeromyxobacter sp.]|nr:RluA family pseudouridine synthase [Anaeromyxobacter sp.]MBL0277697.1 RluA family pseudouridine synthase [Anaeromyxobacter sp.]
MDLALVRCWPDLTRARLQRLLDEGQALVDGRPAKASLKLRGGERLTIALAPPPPSDLVAEDLPLAVLHEDRDLLVLDKAPGMVVHPARGAPSGTVVNAVLHHLGGAAAGARTGLVHRLDKDTSGCLLIAKTEAALATLQAAFKARAVEKTYLALVHGAPPETGRLDTMYGRHPADRTRFTSRGQHARRAVTGWRVLERFGDRAALLEVALETGRTHQIRVHLTEAGHPLLADATYAGRRREARLAVGDPLKVAAAAVGRQALHAWKLAFDHPRTGRRLRLVAPVPADLEAALAVLRAALGGPAPPR